MSISKMREDFRKLAKWSIMKMFEKNPGGTISLGDLKKELEAAWQELSDDGELTEGENDGR